MMKRIVTLSLALLGLGMALPVAATVPPPVATIPPAPSLPAGVLPETQRTRFISFVSGPVTCDGAAAAATALEQPMPSISYAFRLDDTRLPSIKLAFAIDADGRPIDIRADDDGGAKSQFIDTSDVTPAFAAWQFASGAPHRQCRVAFTVQDQPLAAAPRDELTRYYAFLDGNSPDRRQVFDQIRPAGATCYDPYFPSLLEQVLPDYRKVTQRPGTRSFAMMVFGIDRHGRPVAVRVATSDRNRDLDARALAAMRRWRFVDGEAHGGCLIPYANRQSTVPLKAPPSPDVAALRPAGADCEGAGEWTHLGLQTFPEPFRKRSIEGWAIVQYDVAPWGETGNIKVIEAEPAEAFGTQAIETIRQSTKGASKRGYTGCVEKVAFKMSKPGRPGETID